MSILEAAIKSITFWNAPPLPRLSEEERPNQIRIKSTVYPINGYKNLSDNEKFKLIGDQAIENKIIFRK